MDLTELSTNIRNYLADDKVESAISLLFEGISTSEVLNQVILHSATIKRYNKLASLGLVSFDNLSVQRNNVINSLLNLLESIEIVEAQCPRGFIDSSEMIAFMQVLASSSDELAKDIDLVNESFNCLMDEVFRQ